MKYDTRKSPLFWTIGVLNILLIINLVFRINTLLDKYFLYSFLPFDLPAFAIVNAFFSYVLLSKGRKESLLGLSFGTSIFAFGLMLTRFFVLDYVFIIYSSGIGEALLYSLYIVTMLIYIICSNTLGIKTKMIILKEKEA